MAISSRQLEGLGGKRRLVGCTCQRHRPIELQSLDQRKYPVCRCSESSTESRPRPPKRGRGFRFISQYRPTRERGQATPGHQPRRRCMPLSMGQDTSVYPVGSSPIHAMCIPRRQVLFLEKTKRTKDTYEVKSLRKFGPRYLCLISSTSYLSNKAQEHTPAAGICAGKRGWTQNERDGRCYESSTPQPLTPPRPIMPVTESALPLLCLAMSAAPCDSLIHSRSTAASCRQAPHYLSTAGQSSSSCAN